MVETTLTVSHRSGLHARPAALLVQAAKRFRSDVEIATGGRSASAKSILGILALGVEQGARVLIRAEGDDAGEALTALTRLVETNFGEPDVRTIRGLPSSRGIAIGPVYRCCRSELVCERRYVGDRAAEGDRFRRALAVAREQLVAVHAGVSDEFGAGHAAIFNAQAMMLEDPELVRGVIEAIDDQGINAECALLDAAETYAGMLERLDDAYLRVRAADVRDVTDRVLRVLLGLDDSPFGGLVVPSIIVAQDLAPSDMAVMDKSLALGFCTAEGGPTSHTAILARGLGLPAAVGAGSEILGIAAGTLVVLDGGEGAVLVDPDDGTLAEYRRRQGAISVALAEAFAHAREPAVTREGRPVEVLANIGTVAEAGAAIEAGAAGVGLLRTEFLYLGRTELPGEEEQYRGILSIVDALGDRPVVLRTLDLGSDKDVPYLALPREANPFLGLRGIRLGLSRPELLRPQLRAALRAGAGRDVRLLFPLVATLGELQAARALLEDCRAELVSEGRAVGAETRVGVMIEVPAAALIVDKLAAEADFFSIGTNDLSQYLMAADRTNAGVAALVSGFQPAVLRLVRDVIRTAHAFGRPVGLCGELAGEPLAIPILLGLGLDQFSMSPPSVPLAKQILRQLSLSQAEELSQAVLEMDSPEAVQAYVRAQVVGLELGAVYG